MAAKFSMASGMFGQADHAEASKRMQQAMEDLQRKQEYEEEQKQLAQAKEEREQKKLQKKEFLSKHVKDSTYDNAGSIGNNPPEDDDSEDDDDIFLADPELDRLRALRLKQLKSEHSERLENLSKGHGQYREISQDEFLPEVTSSKRVLVHFYHNDFERCKVIDFHLKKICRHHVECKFLRLNAEKAPFFVEKLCIRMLPTIIAFQDGIALDERVIGFEHLTEGLKKGNEDEFQTSALARRLVDIGIIDLADDVDEDITPPTTNASTSIRSSILTETRD